MALYTLSQINDIISKAEQTLINLPPRIEDDKLMKGYTNYDDRLHLIYSLKKSVEWARTNMFSDVRTHKLAAFLNSKVSGIDYGTSITPSSTPATTITVYWGYTGTDPYVNDTTVPSVTFTGSFTINDGEIIRAYLPQAATDQFVVFRVPSSQSTKTTWYNHALNNGTIPDQAFRSAFTIGSDAYYATRKLFAFDYNQPIILS